LRTAVLAALLALAYAAPAAAQMPGGAPHEPPGALTRYYNAATNTHWVTPTPVTAGFAYELPLGFLSTTAGAGRSPLYGCRAGSADHYLSHDAGCEGYTSLGVYGWIDDARTSAGSLALYRCVQPGIGHFASLDAGCEGYPSEGRLGYVRTRQAALSRYIDGSSKHWVTAGSVSGAFRLEATLGFLVADPGENRRALYECAAAADHFLSFDPGCEGRAELGLSGYVYVSPPGDEDVVALYRCRTAADHFASPDAGCEGQVSEGALGYLRRRQEILQRAYNPATNTHQVTSGPIAPGWFHEFALGYVLARPGADRVPFYGCRAGSADYYLSGDAGCEGYTTIGQEGWLYTAPPAGVPSAALYRCLRPGIGHFASLDAGCEGFSTETRLGFLRTDGPEPPPPALQLTCGAPAPRVSLSLRGRKVRRVRYGGSGSVMGRVRNADGTPAAGALVNILIGTRKPVVVGTVTAGADGRFRFKLRPGKNRILHAGVRPAPDAASLACSRVVRLNVRAGITLRAKPERVRAGGVVRFRGRLLGQPIPKVGKLIDLQAFDGGRWRTFQTVRANRKGRYRARYRFTRTFRSRTFRFRARARREARYPYALGTSKVVRVRVRA
jgi:hypothetical protein